MGAHRRGERPAATEIALRLIGTAFFALVAYITGQAAYVLVTQLQLTAQDRWTAVTCAVMLGVASQVRCK